MLCSATEKKFRRPPKETPEYGFAMAEPFDLEEVSAAQLAEDPLVIHAGGAVLSGCSQRVQSAYRIKKHKDKNSKTSATSGAFA